MLYIHSSIVIVTHLFLVGTCLRYPLGNVGVSLGTKSTPSTGSAANTITVADRRSCSGLTRASALSTRGGQVSGGMVPSTSSAGLGVG